MDILKHTFDPSELIPGASYKITLNGKTFIGTYVNGTETDLEFKTRATEASIIRDYDVKSLNIEPIVDEPTSVDKKITKKIPYEKIYHTMLKWINSYIETHLTMKDSWSYSSDDNIVCWTMRGLKGSYTRRIGIWFTKLSDSCAIWIGAQDNWVIIIQNGEVILEKGMYGEFSYGDFSSGEIKELYTKLKEVYENE